MTVYRQPVEPFVLSLSGYARTGKDSVVGALRDLLPDVARVAFADPVREFARDFYGVGDGTEDWWTGERKTAKLSTLGVLGFPLTRVARSNGRHTFQTTGRDLLIHIGMEMRARDPNFWLDQGQRAVEAALADGANVVVVTDARFPNEVVRLGALDGVIAPVSRWHLTRPGTTPQGSADRVVDEIPPSLFTSHLHNGGSLGDLRRSVEELLHREGRLSSGDLR